MTAINQKEYLKRYLSGKRDKKKRKKKSTVNDRVNIIDDDIDISTLNSLEAAADLLNTNEDAPQVVGVIDDRPMHLRINDYRNEFWKPLATQDHSIESSSQLKEIGEKIKLSITAKHRKDESPPRKAKKKRVTRFDESPPRNKDDGDSTPPQEFTRNRSSSPRRSRRESDSSPPRKRDNSPPRRNRRESFDASPPRKSRKGSDSSPPRRRTSDNSPPRRQQSVMRTVDNSPPRRSRKISDSSPPRRSNKDSSPPRKNNIDRTPPRRRNKTRFDNKSDLDTSPARKYIKQEIESPPHASSSKVFEPPPRKLLPGNAKGKYLIPAKRTAEKLTKTLDGKTAGLQNKHELVQENERFVLRETEAFQNMPADISGANATPILRDRKTGKIRDLQKEAEERKEKEKIEEENKEKYSRWGRGLKQVAAYEDKLSEDFHEMNKPLARYADDEDLEQYLKEQEREGDPMLAYIRKKKKKKIVESGKPLKPQYVGEFMPNRFGIVPGYRWDGVDRSNGYEKKWFQVQNAKRAQQEEIYKWSTEDM